MKPLILLASLVAGCSGGSGSLQVFLSAEDTIPNGLQPGTGLENVQDGWTVTYQKYLVVFGNVRAHRSKDPTSPITDPKVAVYDLRALPSDGLVVSTFNGISAERWDKLGFDLAQASAATPNGNNVDAVDYDRMVQNGWSLYFEATLTKPNGQSCPPVTGAACVDRTVHHLKWGLNAATAFDDCADPDSSVGGFAVPTGGTAQIKPTIHGDHWFFDNITQGAEITTRLAQWMVNCDLNGDGETTTDELMQVRAAKAFPQPPYVLSGAVIPIRTAFDYLEAQARTLGDYNGDGECPTRSKL